MKPPPLLLGAALVFWGWHTGLLWAGALAAAVVEAPRFLNARWQFSQADLDRVWNLCVALFLGATIYAFVSSDNLTAVGNLLNDDASAGRLATLNQSKQSLFQLLQWLPLMFLPIVVAQALTVQDRIPLSTFSWWLRRKRNDPETGASHLPAGLNVSYPYFACCLFAASAANHRTLWFPVALVLLIGWALWAHRPRRFGPVGWALSLLVAVAAGLALQVLALEVQKLLQRLDEALFAQWAGARDSDTDESKTRIGSIDRLKLSGRIVLRVQARNQPPPALLRQACFDTFRTSIWFSTKREFERVSVEADQATWILHGAKGRNRTATIAGYFRGGRGLLPVPPSVVRVANLPASSLSTNWFGSVRIEDAPGFAEFDTVYAARDVIEGGPAPEDVELPPEEQDVISELATELNLPALATDSPQRAVAAVEAFFAEHFTYSLKAGASPDLRRRTGGQGTALDRFLRVDHTGHCEYFATATVLLLRAAGIPARYVTGYAVQEKKGSYYVVRERHAHAWCEAWVDGAWHDVDTTPGVWGSVEAGRTSVWEPLQDFFSWVWFQFSRWRWGHTQWKSYLLWLIVPLLAFSIGKLLLNKQWTRAREKSLSKRIGWPGSDSDFYAIEELLRKSGLPRQPGETGIAWLRRISRESAFSTAGLEPLLAWHYRLRFDPRGLSATERAELKSQVRAWLAQT